MKKKRFISVVLVLSLVVGLFAMSGLSANAGTFTLTVSNEHTDGQDVQWGGNPFQTYYLYIGVFNYSTKKVDWKMVNQLRNTTHLWVRGTLNSSNGWKKYLNGTTSMRINSGIRYCYQVHRGKVDKNYRPADSNHTDVVRLTYLETPKVKLSSYGTEIYLNYRSNGADYYWVRRLTTTSNGTTRLRTVYTGPLTSMTFNGTFDKNEVFDVIAVCRYDNSQSSNSSSNVIAPRAMPLSASYKRSGKKVTVTMSKPIKNAQYKIRLTDIEGKKITYQRKTYNLFSGKEFTTTNQTFVFNLVNSMGSNSTPIVFTVYCEDCGIQITKPVTINIR